MKVGDVVIAKQKTVLLNKGQEYIVEGIIEYNGDITIMVKVPGFDIPFPYCESKFLTYNERRNKIISEI